MNEHIYRREVEAHTARRVFIAEGRAVSLIAYDGSRDVYAFDVEEARAEKCYVCGHGPHEPVELHAYWPMSEAAAHFEAEPSGGAYPSMSAAETLDPREAVR